MVESLGFLHVNEQFSKTRLAGDEISQINVEMMTDGQELRARSAKSTCHAVRRILTQT